MSHGGSDQIPVPQRFARRDSSTWVDLIISHQARPWFHPPPPVPLSLSERHNSSSFDFIQLTIPPACTLSRTHTRTFFKIGLIVITVRELKEGLRRKGNSTRFFHFTARTLSFSPWSFLIPSDDASLYLLTLNDGAPPKWFVSSLKQPPGI